MDTPMVAYMGVFQVADARTYGYIYTLPIIVSQHNEVVVLI